MLSIENLQTWAIQYSITDVAMHWVRNHYEKKIDEQLVAIAEKGRQISKDNLTIKVSYISLWTPYKDNNHDSYIVVSLRIGYKEEKGDVAKETDIGMCKLFFTLNGNIDYDEFELF